MEISVVMEWKSQEVYTEYMKQCGICRHLNRKSSRMGFFACAAFIGDQIPEVLRSNKKSHKNPYPGDNGLRFDPVFKGSKQEQLEQLNREIALKNMDFGELRAVYMNITGCALEDAILYIDSKKKTLSKTPPQPAKAI